MRALPRLFGSPAGEALVAEALAACNDLRVELSKGIELEPVPIYDVGAELLGLCVACGAWPGEIHLGDECERGLFWGCRWNPDEAGDLAAVLAVGALFNELALVAEESVLTAERLEERVAFFLGPPAAPARGPERARRTREQVERLTSSKGWTVLRGDRRP